MNKDQFWGCIVGGAIGDALGGQFENIEETPSDPALYVWGDVKQEPYTWRLSDDTQLTLATCESIIEEQAILPEKIASKFLEWHEKGKITGLGSATLQAIQGLRVGGHWALVGKKGEKAAGNGAAMRIAPLAFVEPKPNRELIRDICRITHHNDEAYVGALAVIIALHTLREVHDHEVVEFLKRIARQLPDTLVRERIIEIAELPANTSIIEVGRKFGSSGYVVESVPLALFAVGKSLEMGFFSAMNALVECRGDTDTNASIFGQIAGARLGYQHLPAMWVQEIEQIDEYIHIQQLLTQWELIMQS